MNELKLIQVGLFSFFHFMRVAANASELFCMTPLANIESFLCILIFHFKYQILHTCTTRQLELTKIELK